VFECMLSASFMQAYVVAGRRRHLTAENKAQLRKLNGSIRPASVRTFDWLIESVSPLACAAAGDGVARILTDMPWPVRRCGHARAGVTVRQPARASPVVCAAQGQYEAVRDLGSGTLLASPCGHRPRATVWRSHWSSCAAASKKSATSARAMRPLTLPFGRVVAW
jgi:hypothetical protein